MSKKNFFFSIAAVMAAIAFTSCSQDAEDFANSSNANIHEMGIDVDIAGMQKTTRAAITPVDAWTNGSNIGVTVYQNNTAGALMKDGTQNLKWTYGGSAWTTTTPTSFYPGEEGYVTAYYPWTDGTNPTAISIDNSKDWMYAKLTDNKHVSYSSPRTSLVMNHATAQIKVNIIRKGYAGIGRVTSVTVTSPKMASAATLNSTTGALSGHTLISNFTENFDKILPSEEPRRPTLALHESFVPVDDAAADLVFNVTIDGLKTKCVISQKFDQGKIYTINLFATEELQEILKIGEVAITPWDARDEEGYLELVPPAEKRAVDLGLEVKWAAANLGAEEETDPGLYYMWGETEGHAKGSGYDFSKDSYVAKDLPRIDANLTLAQDAAHTKLGGSWRMPTAQEVEDLINKTNQTWTTINGVSGCKFTNKTDASKYIFIPAAGIYDGTTLDNWGTRAFVWSSTLGGSDGTIAWYGELRSGGCTMSPLTRWIGLSVRAVCE